MKKSYIKPFATVLELETESIIAMSVDPSTPTNKQYEPQSRGTDWDEFEK